MFLLHVMRVDGCRSKGFVNAARRNRSAIVLHRNRHRNRARIPFDNGLEINDDKTKIDRK